MLVRLNAAENQAESELKRGLHFREPLISLSEWRSDLLLFHTVAHRHTHKTAPLQGGHILSISMYRVSSFQIFYEVLIENRKHYLTHFLFCITVASLIYGLCTDPLKD